VFLKFYRVCFNLLDFAKFDLSYRRPSSFAGLPCLCWQGSAGGMATS
jgi:hypothetical protein